MSLNTFVRRVSLVACLGALSSAHASDFPNRDADKEITRQVKLLIAKHPDLGATLTVRTQNGVVYLGGVAFTDFTKMSAEGVAQLVPGVKAVVDLSGVVE